MPAVYNAANEVAVDAFIRGDLRFTGIWKLVEAVMNDHANTDPRGNLAPILEADAWARGPRRRTDTFHALIFSFSHDSPGVPPGAPAPAAPDHHS